MADIVLRDRSGNPVEYPGIDRIKLNTTDGGVQNFGAYDPDTLTPDKLADGVTVGDVTGEMVVPAILEDLPIALDFSGGNQTISAPDGMVVKSAVIQKPDTLTPGNIAEGVDIAGIIGTLVGGGGSVKIASGTFTSASSNTISHNLGVVPDFIILFPTSNSYSTTSTYVAAVMFGVSSALKAAYSFFPGIAYACHSTNTNLRFYYYGRCIDQTYDSGYPNVIRDANETTFIVNRASTIAPAIPENTSMRWIAMGGLV